MLQKPSIILARYLSEILREKGVFSGQIQVIACFLDPDNFMTHKTELELPVDFNPDYHTLEGHTKVDPLSDLFSTFSTFSIVHS